MSAPDTPAQPSLLQDVESLVAAIMAEAPLADIIAITDRIAAAVDHWDGIPAGAVAELSSAVDLMWGGKACATINALLIARSELNSPRVVA